MMGTDKPKHISCEIGEIAEIVVMPGDPLRAKYIAKKYLTDVYLVSKVRNMFAYTGFYNNKRITVMGHGMGMPSMSIYAYELFHYYGVKKIIRIGTCGAVDKKVEVNDIVVVDKAYTESNFAKQYDSSNTNIIDFDYQLSQNILQVANNQNLKVYYGNNITCDVFGPYVNMDAILSRVPADIHLLTEEMEAFALGYIAKKMDRQAAAILTAVDSKFSDKVLTIEEREKSLDTMIKLALDAIIIE